MTAEDITFPSRGVACSAWRFRREGDAFAGPAGRPVVVMAHGFGGTKDAGLRPFAERISAAGIDVLAFDFRGFGGSEGVPLQSIRYVGRSRTITPRWTSRGRFQASTAAASPFGARRCRVVTCSTWPRIVPT